MIICRTPLRVSFFGGGTDYPAWYRDHGGSVLSAAINRYSYITARVLPPFFEYRYRLRYFEQELVQAIDEIQHPVVREAIKYLQYNDRLEIIHNADLPARSGLGSSSAFSVGMLHVLHTLSNTMPTKRELAMQAIELEQDIICENVGSQDQTAAAFGGLNLIHFGGETEIEVNPVPMTKERLAVLQKSLLLCFTGFSRTAGDVAGLQIAKIKANSVDLSTMSALCEEARSILLDNRQSLDEFGLLLKEQWKIKKTLSNEITNEKLDGIYNIGMKNGALGAKLLGAGGGGFILFFAPEEAHEKIRQKLGEKMFATFRFDFTGSQIIYYSKD
jgi:D-glycero-alpha-D-manno-heptose-7-phosphate kinase